MLEYGKGIDIVEQLGGIHTAEEALNLMNQRIQPEQMNKLAPFTDERVLLKIANSIVMCNPDNIFVNTGSEEDRNHIRQQALEKGEEAILAMDGHTIHYDLAEEQGRLVDRTYYIYNEDEDISSLARKMLRGDAIETVKEGMTDIMQGKTMYIGFYSRGPVGAVASNPAIEISSSTYVCHSADLLYRNIYSAFVGEVENLGYFYTNIHSEGLNRPEDLPNARIMMDRAQQTTYSYNCTYAGNTLLMKKGNHRFSVDRAIYAKRAKELSEHMFITGIDGTGGRTTWVAGAAPSGCGKTTTAMAGDRFVGDDLAQMWIDEEGGIRSVNPECGVFGIVEDVNMEGDPILMERLRNPGSEVIWSNVLIKDDIPHWVGNGEVSPTEGFNFQGDWHEGKTGGNGKLVPLSHPNARCTINAKELENYDNDAAENPSGVLTRIITYSGRDSDTMPPIWVAPNSKHGVAIGANIVSAATATEVGATGVKRAPWANAPFIPGALGDYMSAQFEFFGSDEVKNDLRPIMAGLNYFLTHESRGGEGKKLLGEKKDVRVWLAWLERRVHGEVAALTTPIGELPLYEDLKKLFAEIIDKEYPRELYDKQFSLYIDNILARIDLQEGAYRKEEGIPETYFEVLAEQRKGLTAHKEKWGAIVTPDQLS